MPEFAGTTFGANATIARSQFLRAFPAFGDVFTTVNDGRSWYRARQFSLNRRFSDGYTIGVAYTWSKWLQATEYLNAGDAKPTRMISDQDMPHRLAVSGIWKLPFGKGKTFLSEGEVVDRIVGGWQIQGVYHFQIGFPVRFVTDLFYVGGERGLSGDERTTQRWFTTSAFSTVPNSGGHLRTLPLFFDEVRSDNINNVDISVLKNTKINEKMRIQFKVDLINAFNEPYFSAPQTGGDFGRIAASNQDNYARRIQWGLKSCFEVDGPRSRGRGIKPPRDRPDRQPA